MNNWIAKSALISEAPVRLFCLPYAGGSAQLYSNWNQFLSPFIQVCPIHLPGRGVRIKEKPYHNLEMLVDAIVEGIYMEIDRPYAFFGHSMGGLLSFEVVRALLNKGLFEPIHLFVSAHRAPQCELKRDQLHNLPDVEFKNSLATLNGTPEELLNNIELMNLLMPAIRADFSVCENYMHKYSGGPFSFPITAFKGLQDEYFSQQEIEAWNVHTNNLFDVHLLPGDHFYIHHQQKSVLNIIERKLQLTMSMIA